MSEEQPSYKVTDRRLFNPDGSPRDVPEDERPPVEAAKREVPQQPAAVEPPPPEPVKTVADPPSVTPPTADVNAESTATDFSDDDLPGVDDPAGFANFLMSIASNAASALGMMEHPVTHSREVDLELGKHWIDVLGMLQQKTQGNLSPQEQQILEGLLADLRMQYVSLVNATPKSRSFTSQDITGG